MRTNAPGVHSFDRHSDVTVNEQAWGFGSDSPSNACGREASERPSFTPSGSSVFEEPDGGATSKDWKARDCAGMRYRSSSRGMRSDPASLAGGVVIDPLAEGRDAAVVHVRRGDRDVAQR